MLKLKPNPTFMAKVDIPAPGGNVSIKVEFRHMTRDEYKAFIEAEGKSKRTDEEALMDIMRGWANVDAEFNKDNVAELCQQYHAAPRAIVEAFIRELTQFKLGN
jgi:hypothetical protein